MIDTRPPATGEDASTPPARGRSRLDRLALLAPGAVMLVLGVWGLRRGDAMGNDEVATRWIASLPLPAMRHVLGHLDAVHGLYYAVIHVWMVFGRSPTTIRVPSVIAMAAAVVGVAALARRLTGSTRAGVAAGLVAASTSSITFYAQTARSYTMVYLVVVLATLVLVRALDPERAGGTGFAGLRPWLPYALLVVLGAYLNELSLLVLAAHLVTVLWARRGPAVFTRWLGASVVAVVLALPLIRLSRQQSKVLEYLRPPGGKNVWSLFHLVFGGTTAIAVVVAVVAAVGLVARPATPDVRRALPPAAVALPLLVVPAAVLMLYSEVTTPLYADRYVLFAEAGAAVLAGAGLDLLVSRVPLPRPRVVGAVVVAVACVAVFLGQLGPQRAERTSTSRQFDFGGPAAYVGARARPGDGVLFFGLFYRKMRLGYPDDFRHTADFAQQASPEQVASFRGRNLPFAQVRPLMLQHERIWVVGRPPGSVEKAVSGIRPQALELRRNFERVGGHRFGKISATLWQRR